jgi:parallel beta-helix repeat protein
LKRAFNPRCTPEKGDGVNKLFFGVVLVSLLAGVLFFAVGIQSVKADGAIYIRADGSVEGTTSIQTVDNVTYFFVADVNGSIVVERDNIVLDGAGRTLQGNGTGTGIDLSNRNNVTIQNVQITVFDTGISLYGCSDCIVAGNNITANNDGINENFSQYNLIFHNNFINNTQQAEFETGVQLNVFDDGYPSGGNYWSDYNGTDLRSGPYQNESGSDGIGDSQYIFGEGKPPVWGWWIVVQDNYPLTIPYGSNLPFAIPAANFTNSSTEPVSGEATVFNASTSTCINGSIRRYNWDFGDGEIGAGQIVSHVYSAYGNYSVSLTTVSSTFISDTKNQSIYVREAPIANFSFSSTPAVGYPITFDASASEPRGGSITGYVWDFGDGNTTSTDKPTMNHTFAFQNAFNVTLTVLDSENLNSSFSNSFLVIMPTFLSIHTSSSSNVVGYAVNVNGILNDFYGVPLENKTVILSYIFPGAASWLQITSANTNSLGEYHATWIPTATGDFTLKAECGGNATHLGANGMVSLSTLSYMSEDVFSVESNSTIAAMSINPAGSKLTFSVSGEEHTLGYVKVTLAKGFAKSNEDVKVYLDGTPTTFSVASTDDSWAITSTYTHSTHSFEVDLTPEASENIPAWGFWTIVAAAASVTIVVAIALVVLGIRRSKRKEPGKQAKPSSDL